jgi:hypothetical protein
MVTVTPPKLEPLAELDRGQRLPARWRHRRLGADELYSYRRWVRSLSTRAPLSGSASLVAIAGLIEARRDEFETLVIVASQRREWLEKKAAMKK